MSGEIDEREALKTMSGHDPFTTVMVCVHLKQFFSRQWYFGGTLSSGTVANYDCLTS